MCIRDRISISSFVLSCLDDMLARANSVCLLALSRSDRRVLSLLLVRVHCATSMLCCAVLCLRSKESNGIQEGSPTNITIVGNYRLKRVERWENISRVSSEVGEI